MIKHSQITRSNKFAISLIYLKNEVRYVDYHVDKRQFYKLVLSFLMEVARHVQNTQNRKFVIFLQKIQIFYGGPVMFLVTCCCYYYYYYYCYYCCCCCCCFGKSTTIFLQGNWRGFFANRWHPTTKKSNNWTMSCERQAS